MNEKDAKFFRPLWIRIAVTAVVVVWFLLEALLSHDQLWMGVTAVGIVYCIWNFFLRFPKETAAVASAAAGPDEAPPNAPPATEPPPPKQP